MARPGLGRPRSPAAQAPLQAGDGTACRGRGLTLTTFHLPLPVPSTPRAVRLTSPSQALLSLSTFRSLEPVGGAVNNNRRLAVKTGSSQPVRCGVLSDMRTPELAKVSPDLRRSYGR